MIHVTREANKSIQGDIGTAIGNSMSFIETDQKTPAKLETHTLDEGSTPMASMVAKDSKATLNNPFKKEISPLQEKSDHQSKLDGSKVTTSME